MPTRLSQRPSGQQILVVDDEAAIRTVLRIALESAGYIVTDATDGQHALRLLNTVQFDLILLDFNMPVIDGAAMLEQLGPLDRSTPVIVLTAYGSVQLTARMMRLGAADFLEKPIVPNDLLASVANVLTNRSRPTAPPSTFAVPGIDPLSVGQVLRGARQAFAADHPDVVETLLHQLARNVPDVTATASYLNLRGLVSELRGRLLAAVALYRMASNAKGHTGYWPIAENAWRLYDSLRGRPHGNGRVALGTAAELRDAFGDAGVPPSSSIERLRAMQLDCAFAVTPPRVPRPDPDFLKENVS